MSDYVATIDGGVVGRDHFPFLVPTVSSSEVGIGTVYPIGISLQDACEAYYRIKKWRIDVNIVRAPDPEADPPGEPQYSVGTFYAEAGQVIDVNTEEEVTPPFGRERDLVIPRFTFNGDNTTTSNFGLFGNVDEYSNPTGYRAVWRNNGLIYPMFIIETEVDGGPSSDFSPAPPNPSAICNFMGNVFTLYANETRWSGTVDIYGVRWWPYVTKLGLPVWSGTTGVMINSPFDLGELYETITQNKAGTPQTLNVKTDSQPWIPV